MTDMIRNLELPNGDVYDLPGKAYASTDEWDTPNVEKFEGTTQGKLEATAETYGKIYVVPTPVSGKGGDVVEWTQITQPEEEGATHIADILINGIPTEVYAVGGGGGGGDITPAERDALNARIEALVKKPVEWNQITTTGTKIAEITLDGNKTNVYAPNGGGGGSTIEITDLKTTGEKIATITIDGTAYTVKTPITKYVVNETEAANGVKVGEYTDESGNGVTNVLAEGLTNAERDDLLDKIDELTPADGVGRFKSVIIDDHDSPIGTTLKVNLPSQRSLSKDEWTGGIISINLSPGTWIIMGRVRAIAYNTSYAMAMNIEPSTTSEFIGATYHHDNTVTSSTHSSMFLPSVVTLTETTTYYLNARAYQAAPQIDTYTHLQAIRIA